MTFLFSVARKKRHDYKFSRSRGALSVTAGTRSHLTFETVPSTILKCHVPRAEPYYLKALGTVFSREPIVNTGLVPRHYFARKAMTRQLTARTRASSAERYFVCFASTEFPRCFPSPRGELIVNSLFAIVSSRAWKIKRNQFISIVENNSILPARILSLSPPPTSPFLRSNASSGDIPVLRRLETLSILSNAKVITFVLFLPSLFSSFDNIICSICVARFTAAI